jgi:hypothetical protein
MYSEAASLAGAENKLSLILMRFIMSREETPIWLKRRIERRRAKGKDTEATARVLMKHKRLRQTAECEPTPTNNVVPFIGVSRLRMPELGLL